ECHVVPVDLESPGHVDTSLPAEVTFSGVASAHGARPAWNGATCADSFCHAPRMADVDAGGTNTAPDWTGTAQAYCGSCHSGPPRPPPPALAGCGTCHTNVDVTGAFRNPALHVNGVVDF